MLLGFLKSSSLPWYLSLAIAQFFMVCGFKHVKSDIQSEKSCCWESPLLLTVAKMPSDIITNFWPYLCRGEVVKGFGRGSKELGIPTGECRAKKLDSSGSKCSFFTQWENNITSTYSVRIYLLPILFWEIVFDIDWKWIKLALKVVFIEVLRDAISAVDYISVWSSCCAICSGTLRDSRKFCCVIYLFAFYFHFFLLTDNLDLDTRVT